MAVVYFTSNASTGVGSLSEAIHNARPGDVVRPDEAVFERGATIEIALASTLTIDKNLTLDASPFRVRLDGGGATRCVVVATGVNVRFTSFDFIGGGASQNGGNGDESGNGGGLRVERGASVVLSRCRVCGCDAAQYGGGIYVDDAASLTLADSAVFGNRAQSSGGGLYLAASSNIASNGATVAANVDAASNGWADVVAASGFDAASQTPRNSIIGAASSEGSVLYDATSTTAAGSVVGVSVGEVGFVAPGGVSAPFESWSRNAWQNIDLRLLDDASPNPSPYRDAGDVDNMSRYDVQGNFRGRETGGAASCSPGAYETLQADLFWVGVDASGASVASPTLLSADGWATSRFASASGDTAPQLGQTLFVDGVVSFSDVLSTTSTQTFGLTLGGGAVVTFEPIQIVYCSTFTLGAGSTFGGLRGRLIGPRQRLRFGANARINTTTLRISINDVWFDAGGYVAACECYAFAPPEPRYGALTILRATTATTKLSGAYYCESFKTARSGDSASYSLPTAPGTSIRCRSFEYKLDFAEGRLFTNAVVVELYGDATATVSRTGTTTLDVAADFAVDATDATSATLTLDGQTVYGDASNAAVELTGSAKIDERGLTAQALNLPEGATLTLKDGRLSIQRLTTSAGSQIVGQGVVEFPSNGRWTDDGATLNGVAISQYDAASSGIQIIYRFDAAEILNAFNDGVYRWTSAALDSGTLPFEFGKYGLDADGVGSYQPIYNSSQPILDTTSPVYETASDWNGETLKTVVHATPEAGWNFYRVEVPAFANLGGAKVYHGGQTTRYFVFWNADYEPEPTYYYCGGATGSFTTTSDWSLSADGIAKFEGAPITQNATFFLPVSATLRDCPRDHTQISALFPSIVDVYNSDGRRLFDAEARLVSVGVPTPSAPEFYVGKGGTSGFWTQCDGATLYRVEAVDGSAT